MFSFVSVHTGNTISLSAPADALNDVVIPAEEARPYRSTSVFIALSQWKALCTATNLKDFGAHASLSNFAITSNYSKPRFINSVAQYLPTRFLYLLPLICNRSIDYTMSLPKFKAVDETATLVDVEPDYNNCFKFNLQQLVGSNHIERWSASVWNDFKQWLLQVDEEYTNFFGSISSKKLRGSLFGTHVKEAYYFGCLLNHLTGARMYHVYGTRDPRMSGVQAQASGNLISSYEMVQIMEAAQVSVCSAGASSSSVPSIGLSLQIVLNTEFLTQPQSTAASSSDPYREIRNRISELLHYSANPTAYIPNSPFILEGERNPITFGVEYETSSDYTPRELAFLQEVPFFIAKNDSSIRGSKHHPAELVTVPMSLAAQRQYWADFFESVDYGKFDTSRETGNGLHIHVHRTRFSESQRHHICWFFVNPVNHEFLRILSERNEQSLNSYAALPRGDNVSHTNLFKNAERYAQAAGRGALNLQSGKPTIEFRLFKGIFSYAELSKAFDFIESLMEWTDDFSLNYQQSTLKNYIRFVKSSPASRWIAFKEYLDKIDIDSIVTESEEGTIINSYKTNPQILIQKIKEHNIPINNSLIYRLNVITNVRWVMRKGSLEVYENPVGSRLADMDKVLSSRHKSYKDKNGVARKSA